MRTSAAGTFFKGTHANKSMTRTPLAVATIVCVTLALCATTQVLCSKLNKTVLPPLSLSLENALSYLSANQYEDDQENARYSSQYSNVTTNSNLRQSRFSGEGVPQKSYALSMANSFLSYFFDEIESGLD